MKDVAFFLQKDIWIHLNEKGKSSLRADVCNVMTKTAVCTDISKNELAEDEYLFQVWNDNGGRFEFDFSNKEIYINSLSAVPVSSTFLVMKDTDFCETKLKKQGVVVLNEELLDKNFSFFKQKESYVSKGKNNKYYKGWEEEVFQPILGGHHCNALILQDKYICKEGNVSRMNENLKPLLKMVLPNELDDMSFHLSIFSQFDRDQGNRIYQEISDFIHFIRPKLDVQFTLYQTYEIHDRLIITNAYMIEVGAGFALFKNGVAANETTIRYYPYKKPDYFQRLKSVARISKKSEANENLSNHWGNKENRLFELVEW